MHSANSNRIDRIAIISLRHIFKFTTSGQRTKTWFEPIVRRLDKRPRRDIVRIAWFIPQPTRLMQLLQFIMKLNKVDATLLAPTRARNLYPFVENYEGDSP